MWINKTIKSANFIKLHSPNYYILTNNIIDCNFTKAEARNMLNVEYPRLAKQIDDKEWDRVVAVYKLLHSVRMIKFKLREGLYN